MDQENNELREENFVLKDSNCRLALELNKLKTSSQQAAPEKSDRSPATLPNISTSFQLPSVSLNSPSFSFKPPASSVEGNMSCLSPKSSATDQQNTTRIFENVSHRFVSESIGATSPTKPTRKQAHGYEWIDSCHIPVKEPSSAKPESEKHVLEKTKNELVALRKEKLRIEEELLNCYQELRVSKELAQKVSAK